MKKALLAGLCFVLVSFALVNGTFALPDLRVLENAFADLTNILGEALGLPQLGGTVVDVELVSDNATKNLYPGASASRASYVSNNGTGDVYFRLVYAVQYDAESWPKLDIDFTVDENFFAEERSSTNSLNANGYDAEGWKNITIGETPYKMKVFTYKHALPAGGSSPDVTISIAMDTDITSEQMARYGSDFVKTQVLAIETTAFAAKDITDATAALDRALPLNKLNPF